MDNERLDRFVKTAISMCGLYIVGRVVITWIFGI